MKAMLLEAPGPVDDGPLVLGEVAQPVPSSKSILVRVSACGVCRTDLHQVEGDLPMRRRPVIPGHQIVGTVAEVGTSATRFKVGDRVGIAWLNETCGRCEFCSTARENLCDNARLTGWNIDGGYAEFALVPQKYAYALPEGFDDEQAAPLLCAGIIGYRALRLSGVQDGQRLGLYGFGGSAHVTIQVARHMGCEVYVFTRGAANRALARQLGAVWTGSADQRPPERMHGSIIFAPAGPLVPAALSILEKGGTVALAGIHMSAIPEMDYAKHLYGERVVRSVANSTRRDGEELLDLAARIPIRTKTTSYPLESANQALGDLKHSRVNGAAVLTISA